MNREAWMIYFSFILLCVGAVNNAPADEQKSDLLNLPEDTSPRLIVQQLHISGNSLISTEDLLKDMPLIYNTSAKPLHQAEPGDLYDFGVLHEIIQSPGQARKVSKRTMQGLTQYILSVYQDNDYAGIYVYISAKAVQDDAVLPDGVLPIEIVEARISEITVNPYDTERNKVEKSILQSSILENWSPVKVGQTVNKKKLDDFVDMLNLNPDRYVSAVLSRGSEPDSLALGYDIYEADPWHYYIQVDDAGSEERQWAPKLGVVNTNVTGIDDRLSALYQGPWESGIEDNYAFFGSYEFPVFIPSQRFSIYGGRSEFDVSSGTGIDFLGKGSFYGIVLRSNILQSNGWYLNVTNSLSHENSKVSPTLFQTTDIDIDLWTIGADLHRSDDMSSTSIAFNRAQSVGGSSREKFQDARLNTTPHFNIYTLSGGHSQYLDTDKIQRLSGSFRWIIPDERLTPSKMTVFGGLYSARGYKEDEIVADGGVFVSAQYEFDITQHIDSKENSETESEADNDTEKSWLKKAALLSFMDFARANTKSPVPGEIGTQELCSVGLGLALSGGENFDANIYYGWALRPTVDTHQGQGRWGFSFTLRW